MVGGSTLWCSAITALNRPAAPAAALVWPICDFTEPSAHHCFATRLVEHDAQALELGGVARLGARAVGLDQLDGLGAVARELVGPAQRRAWPSGTGA
jgi:hypothetical protein